MGPQLLIVLLVAGLASAALPMGWKACKRSEKDYGKCLGREMENAIHSLVSGNKKLGALPLDPLRITSVEIPRNPGPVNIALSFQNLDIVGIKNIKLKDVNNDWKILTCTAVMPDISLLGDYKIDGKILVIPVVGSGKCNLTLHELKLKIIVDWKQIEKGGKKYFQMEKFQMDILPERLYIQLDNLFNGDKALGDNTNLFMNENWEQILEEVKPGISQALSQTFMQVANTILMRLPAEDIDK